MGKFKQKKLFGTEPNGAKSIDCVEKKTLITFLSHFVTSMIAGFIFYLILFCLRIFSFERKSVKKN